MSKVRSKIRKAKGREEEETGAAAVNNPKEGKELLCCLPEGQGSVECSQRVIEDPLTAVKMTCSSVQCSKSGLLHAKCFERLEKHLLKALAATPTGKKWTEAQLQSNVWNCRGADILHRFSKCSCGGTLAKAEEKHEAPAPIVKKKEKLSQKPKLNCDGVQISYSKMKMFKNTVTEENTHGKASPVKYPKDEESLGEKVDPLQVFAGNLPNDCTENDLEELFGKFGKVTEVRLHHPSPTPPCDYFVPSFAFVAFETAACVQRVLAARPIKHFGNQKLKVEEKKWCDKDAPKKVSSKPSPKSSQLPLRSLPLLKSDLPKKKYSNPRGYNTEDHPKILHVSSLPEDCCENDLGELFEKYGKVTDVWISAPPSNFAFVTFTAADGVEQALADLPISIYGQRLHVDRKKPRTSKLSTSSSSKDECTCPPSRLCTCPTSCPKPQPPCPPQAESGIRSQKPAANIPTKLAWASQVHPQKVRHEDWKDFEMVPANETEVVRLGNLGSQGFNCEDNREFFRELLGTNCLPAVAQEEIFVSDEEDEVDEFQSASGTNEECEEAEERRRQEELEDLFSRFQEMALEKTRLEQLVSEKVQQEREFLEAKKCIKVLEEKMGALMEQQVRDREMVATALTDATNAKASNKVLREKMETVQKQLEEKEVREKLLEQKLCQEQDLQERLVRENEELKAEVYRLTGVLESLSNGENTVGRMARGTQSAPGGLVSLAPVWECSTCTYHNLADNPNCEMCGYLMHLDLKSDPIPPQQISPCVCSTIWLKR